MFTASTKLASPQISDKKDNSRVSSTDLKGPHQSGPNNNNENTSKSICQQKSTLRPPPKLLTTDSPSVGMGQKLTKRPGNVPYKSPGGDDYVCGGDQLEQESLKYLKRPSAVVMAD